MGYVDAMVAAVPESGKAAFKTHAERWAALFKQHGAVRLVDCWGDDVPEGKLTSFPLAVKREPGEVVVVSWIEWPSKEVRDAAWPKLMEDPRMNDPANAMPFDGKRMIYGGFTVLADQ